MQSNIGRDERIRTSDLVVPNDALYQAEPHPDDVSPNYTASLLAERHPNILHLRAMAQDLSGQKSRPI